MDSVSAINPALTLVFQALVDGSACAAAATSPSTACGGDASNTAPLLTDTALRWPTTSSAATTA